MKGRTSDIWESGSFCDIEFGGVGSGMKLWSWRTKIGFACIFHNCAVTEIEIRKGKFCMHNSVKDRWSIRGHQDCCSKSFKT